MRRKSQKFLFCPAQHIYNNLQKQKLYMLTKVTKRIDLKKLKNYMSDTYI